MRAVFLVAAVGLTVAACTPSESPPSMATPQPLARPAGLPPLVTDPPERIRAANPSETTYSVYQGVVCGIVPRPEYGYTVRYPKIWETREHGPTTWLVDVGNGGPVQEQIGTAEAIEPDDDANAERIIGAVDASQLVAPAAGSLERSLAEGWQARGLIDLRLEAVPDAHVGGQPGARWNLRYTDVNGTPMAGYTSAAIMGGRLYRVEIAMPVTRYARLERASSIVADQLLISRSAALPAQE